MVVRANHFEDHGGEEEPGSPSPETASRSASPSPKKGMKSKQDKATLRFNREATWRKADFLVLWDLHGGNNRGYITSIEAKKLLLEFGVPWRQVTHHIKPGHHWDFDACFEKLQILLPSDRMAKDVQKLMEKTDMDENHGSLSGLINVETLRKALQSHGLDELETDLFLSKYTRESVNKDTITWGTMLQNLYGHEETQKPRLQGVMSIFTARRDIAEFRRKFGPPKRDFDIDPAHFMQHRTDRAVERTGSKDLTQPRNQQHRGSALTSAHVESNPMENTKKHR